MVSILIPTSETLNYLWKKFNENRELFPDELPTDPIEFACWLGSDDLIGFIVGPDDKTPSGVFIFQGITQNISAFCHVFVWDRFALPYKELVKDAKDSCSAVMLSRNLQRLNGLTPVTHARARIFAEAVGFKIEGTMRKAAQLRGEWVDAWFSGMTREDAGLKDLDDTIARKLKEAE